MPIDPKSLGEAAGVWAALKTDAATKLVEVVAAGAGKVYEPFHRRRLAKADAAALVEMAKGKAEAQEIELRAVERLLSIAARRQENIEAIVESARAQLPGEASSEPVDPDWAARYFDACQDVSDNDMRERWGKLLAREVTEPRSFSLRTLAVFGHMTRAEAELFERLCAGSLRRGKHLFPMIFDLQNDALAAIGLGTFEDIQALVDAGLISLTSLVLPADQTSSKGVGFDAGEMGVLWAKPPEQMNPLGLEKFGLSDFSKEISLGAIALTPTGRQLAVLTAWSPSQARVDAAALGLQRIRHTVVVESVEPKSQGPSEAA